MNFKMLSILSRLPVAIYLDICIISAALLIQTINYIYQDFFWLLIHTWPRLKENIIFCKIPFNIISICEHQYKVEVFMNFVVAWLQSLNKVDILFTRLGFVTFDIWQSKKCICLLIIFQVIHRSNTLIPTYSYLYYPSLSTCQILK